MLYDGIRVITRWNIAQPRRRHIISALGAPITHCFVGKSVIMLPRNSTLGIVQLLFQEHTRLLFSPKFSMKSFQKSKSIEEKKRADKNERKVGGRFLGWLQLSEKVKKEESSTFPPLIIPILQCYRFNEPTSKASTGNSNCLLIVIAPTNRRYKKICNGWIQKDIQLFAALIAS